MAVSIYTPSGNINKVSKNINPFAQWLSQYICPVAILVLSQQMYTYTPNGYLNTYAQWQY